MWKLQNKFLFLIILGPFFIIGGIMIAAHFGFDPLSMGKVDTGKNALLFQGIFMIISPTAVTALILLFVHIHNQKIRYILENGIYAKAILHDIQTTGVEINNIPQYLFKLEIHRPDKPVYFIDHKECMNAFTISGLKKGMELNILVHPEKNDKIVVNWE